MKTVVFIALQLSQPRCLKRISTIASANIPIKIYGFDSGLYNDNLKDLPFSITEIIKRDKSASPIQKIIFFTQVIKKILRENKQNSTFYLFGFEITAIAWLLGCRNYIYEEADVTASRTKNKVLKTLLLNYDRFLYRHAKLVISTSEGFIRYLFKKGEEPNNIIMLPNKLNIIFTENIRNNIRPNKTNINNIKFGFIGLIRYPNTIIRFAKIIGKLFPMHEFHFYGEPENPKYVDKEILSYKNVYFHGRFKNPQDLQSIYEAIDINIVCYDTQSDNVKIAEPNKLYESIYFKTPIVVSKNTFLAEKVKKYGVGYEINCADDDQICDFVKHISKNSLLQTKEQMEYIPTKELVDNSQEFIEHIKTVI